MLMTCKLNNNVKRLNQKEKHFMSIDVYGKGVISCTPSKDFEKFGHTYAIKQENRFSHNPKYPKEFENVCASIFRINKMFNPQRLRIIALDKTM